MPKDEWAKARAKDAANRSRSGNRPVRARRITAHSPLNRKPGPKFRLPIGTVVSICKRDDQSRHWKRHVMRRELEFHQEFRSNTTHGSSGAVVLQYGDYLILTRRDKSST